MLPLAGDKLNNASHFGRRERSRVTDPEDSEDLTGRNIVYTIDFFIFLLIAQISSPQKKPIQTSKSNKKKTMI